jgi:hypothetical protein
MNDIITKVINQEVEWSRIGFLTFENNTVILDTSNGEYGPLEFDLNLLEEKLKEHKEKLNKQL